MGHIYTVYFLWDTYILCTSYGTHIYCVLLMGHIYTVYFLWDTYILCTSYGTHIYCVLLMGHVRATCKRSWPSPFHSSIMLSIPLVILTMNVLKCRTPRRHEFMPCGRVDHSLIHQGLHRYFKLHMSGGGGARLLRNCEQLLRFHK